MLYAVVSSFASVFLLARGFSNSEIGLTLAVANVLAVVLQPLTADIADRSEKLGPIEISEIMTVMMGIFLIGLFLFGQGSMALCISFVLLIAWHTALQPMFNALTFRLEESGIAVNFGVARSVGSLAYSILVAFLGSLVEHFGILVCPVTGEIVCVMLLISLLLTGATFRRARRMHQSRLQSRAPAAQSETDAAAGKAECSEVDAATGQAAQSEAPEEKAASKAAAEPADSISLGDFIRRNRLFFVLNLGVVGIFFSNATLNNYMIQIVEGVGGNSEDMGRILGVMAFLEIPTMVVFSRLKRRFSCQLMLKVASVGFTVKILMCWLANSVGMIFAAQAFQLVSFALFLPGMVYFTGEMMSRGEAVRGQALFTTMITVTTIFSSLLGGWILDVSGPKLLTGIATAATAAGAVVVFAVIDRIGRKDGADR